MKFRIFTGSAVALSALLTSCYPYKENRTSDQATQAAAQTTAQQEVKTKADQAIKDQENAIKKTAETTAATDNQTPAQTPPQQPATNPPAEPKKVDYDFANKVPGKEGFVFSPYNNKVVDVRDIPSGTLVQDPTYPASEKKYFRVP